VNLFSSNGKAQVLMDLSLNLRGIISQRLVPSEEGGRVPAVEVMINTPYISDLIKRGEVGEIKTIMEKGAAAGMQTFDQALYDLYKSEKISLDDALGHADSRGNLEWQINFGGGVKSVSETSDNLQFPSEPAISASNGKASIEPPTLSDSVIDGEALDSHIGFDDHKIMDHVSSNDDVGRHAEPSESIIDDGDGKDTGYLDRLKSVFGEQ